jgi:hypothetical protein
MADGRIWWSRQQQEAARVESVPSGKYPVRSCVPIKYVSLILELTIT